MDIKDRYFDLALSLHSTRIGLHFPLFFAVTLCMNYDRRIYLCDFFLVDVCVVVYDKSLRAGFWDGKQQRRAIWNYCNSRCEYYFKILTQSQELSPLSQYLTLFIYTELFRALYLFHINIALNISIEKS